MTMEHERKCSTKEILIFFILNLSIWLESGIVLGFGIVGLTIVNFVPIVMNGNLFICLVVIYVIVGGAGIISCFVGCCGAITGNRCIMLTYVTILGITVILLFTGAIFGFVFSNQLQANSSEAMLLSLSKYDLDKNVSDTVRGWDWLQKELKCCGVTYYKDWEDENIDFRGTQKIPMSCCKEEYIRQGIENCTYAKKNGTYYSSLVDGCHGKVLDVFEKYAPVVVGIGGMDAILLIIGITCGGIAYNFL